MEGERCMDGYSHSYLAPPFLGGIGLGVVPPVGDRRPPPLIQEDQAPALMLSCTTRHHYLPHSMHVAYVAKDKGVVGRVNWQFVPRVLKSFTGHYWSGLLALHDAWGNRKLA